MISNGNIKIVIRIKLLGVNILLRFNLSITKNKREKMKKMKKI